MKKAFMISAISALLVFGLVATAQAWSSSQVGSVGDALSSGNAVTVTAKANPKLELTLPDSVAFGDIDPEVWADQPLAFTVRSNKLYTITRTPVGNADIDVAVVADVQAPALGVRDFTDTARVRIPITTAADTAVSGSIQYTVTQN